MNGIEWVAESPHFKDFGYYLVFARGLSESEFIARVGGDPETALTMTAEESYTALLDDEDDVIRVGATAEWAFAVAPGFSAFPPGVLEALSEGGVDVVLLSNNGNALLFFAHIIDGAWISSFEPASAHTRSGTDLDRWVPALRRVGLLTSEGLSPLTSTEVSLNVGRLMMRMVEEEFGVNLPLEIYEGPLRVVRAPAP